MRVQQVDEPFACFTLSTGNGQTATIRLTQADPHTAFNVSGVADNRDQLRFTTKATQYRIDLYQMNLRNSGDRPAPFTLEVAVH